VRLIGEGEELGAMTQKGEALIERGQYDAGIAVLETVWGRDPMNTRAFSGLLSGYDFYSKKLIKEGRFEQARVYLKKMQSLLEKMDTIPMRELPGGGDEKMNSRVKREIASAKVYLADPQNAAVTDDGAELVSLNSGREMYNEAVQHFNKREYELAEDLLKDSIKFDSQNPYAYELLGDIASLNQRLPEAENYYQKAFSLNSNKRFKDKYEKLIKEKKIDSGKDQYTDEHFIIRYERGGTFEGAEIRQFLRDAYRAISQEFGYYPKYQIPVILLDRTEYQVFTDTAPQWSGALYDGKMRIPIYPISQDKNNLKRLIYHELTHAFVTDLSQGVCPVWLQEGLAQYEENKIQPLYLKTLNDAIKTNSLIDKEELMTTDVSSYHDKLKAHLFYLQSYSIVSYMLTRHRIHQVKQLLIALGKKMPFPDAFEKSFSLDFNTFWNNWQKSVMGSYSKKR
jgi:tetratricopeptide (TPR) repeat protein